MDDILRRYAGLSIVYIWSETSSPMSQWQRHQFLSDFERCGIHVRVFDPSRFDRPEAAGDALGIALRQSAGDVDLVMTCLGSGAVTAEMIFAAKRLSIPTLLICFDNLARDGNPHAKAAVRA